MLNANELLQKGIKQVKAAGIEPGNINPQVIINSRAKNRFGACRKTTGKYDFQIELNSQLLHAEEKKAMNTMVHEILHSAKGCMNHGVTWTKYADIMNEKFGYDISRTSSYEQLGLVAPKAKFVVKCKGCDAKFNRHRKSKLITHTHRYRCGMCNGNLVLL